MGGKVVYLAEIGRAVLSKVHCTAAYFSKTQFLLTRKSMMFHDKNSFDYDDLLQCARCEIFGALNTQLHFQGDGLAIADTSEGLIQ